jgi:hypothetical protein
MSLADTITAAVSTLRAAVLTVLTPVTVERKTGHGTDGAPAFAVGVVYQALVERKPRRFWTQEGTGVDAAWTITIPEPVAIEPGDRMTWDGEARLVVETKATMHPETGIAYAIEVFCS